MKMGGKISLIYRTHTSPHPTHPTLVASHNQKKHFTGQSPENTYQNYTDVVVVFFPANHTTDISPILA